MLMQVALRAPLASSASIQPTESSPRFRCVHNRHCAFRIDGRAVGSIDRVQKGQLKSLSRARPITIIELFYVKSSSMSPSNSLYMASKVAWAVTAQYFLHFLHQVAKLDEETKPLTRVGIAFGQIRPFWLEMMQGSSGEPIVELTSVHSVVQIRATWSNFLLQPDRTFAGK